MASTPPTHNNDQSQIIPVEEDTPYSTPRLRAVGGRRTSSFSSSTSPSDSWDSSFGSSLFSFSSHEEFAPFSPSTPLKFKGIPFSWEQLPGIPKHQLGSKKKELYSSDHLLPLPPAGNHSNNSSIKKYSHHQEEISPKKHQTSYRFQKDPFYAALVECSKDDQGHNDNNANFWKGSSKISRTLSDRFGFISMYTSCKRTCAVSESLVYLPRSTPHYLLNRRSS